jgi:hypothetical protein
MGENKKLEDMFKTVGLPPYTYVKPAYYGEVRADISQPGKYLLIEGAVRAPSARVREKRFEDSQRHWRREPHEPERSQVTRRPLLRA